MAAAQGLRFQKLPASHVAALLDAPVRRRPRDPARHRQTSLKATPERPTIIPPPHLPEKGSPIYDNCAFLVDKPLTFTSHDVCAKLKPTLNARKIGHAGTLDKLASGLLVVCMGKGTKSAEHFMGQQKQYSGSFKLGEATASYDAETDVTQTAAWEHLTDEDLQSVATGEFTGEIQQVPPIFSAIKIGGRKMYEVARAGETVPRAPRPVTVEQFRVWRDDASSPLVRYKVVCSKGTYVRSLVHDLGQKLGTCAYVRELRRDRSGEFRVEDAWQLDDLVDRAWERGLPRYQDRKMKTVHESVAAETSKVGEASTAEGLSADTESSRAHAVA